MSRLLSEVKSLPDTVCENVGTLSRNVKNNMKNWFSENLKTGKERANDYRDRAADYLDGGQQLLTSYLVQPKSVSRRSSHFVILATGLSVGAAIMYFADPNRGRRRRAAMQDKVTGAISDTSDAIHGKSKNVKNRVSGMMAETKGMFRHNPISDDQLVLQIKSKISRVVSASRALEINAENGHVTLKGPLLHYEVAPLMAYVRKMRGVKGITNKLVAHPTRESFGKEASEKFSDEKFHFQEMLPSATRSAAGVAGAALTVVGLRSRGILGWSAATAGSMLLSRAITNLPMSQLTGIGAGRRAVAIRKVIEIDVPVDEVFDFWKHFENFPRFMSHLKEVKDLGNGRSHWVAVGPAGVTTEWDAVVTRIEPNEMIGWKSEEGFAMQNAGSVRFEGNGTGGTRITVQMSYNPPGGAIGHALLSVLGTNPKQAMSEDLLRLQALLEEGVTKSDGKKVTLDQMSAEVASLAPGEISHH